MTEDLGRRLEAARARQREIGWSNLPAAEEAADEVLEAERALAAARGDQYAEVIDIGFRWDVGAPLPHVIANGSRAFVVCHVGEPDRVWDGSSVEVVSPANASEDLFGVIEFWGCASIRLGEPNDEALAGHPLSGKGLRAYAAHEVRNSAWLEEHIRINRIHPQHSDEAWRRLHHYLLAFHDDMFESLATGVEGHLEWGSLQSLMDRLTRELVQRPSER